MARPGPLRAPARVSRAGSAQRVPPRTLQTAEGELEVEIPQVREAAEPFVSSCSRGARKLLRTEPLKAMVIGAFVRGLSMRDVESLCEEAGLASCPSPARPGSARSCANALRPSQRRDLYEVRLVALFLDAAFLAGAPDGPKEGVLVAWGFTDAGERVLLSVMLGMRESYEDWLELGRDLIARGLGAPMLIVADGAPGLIKAIEQCWPDSDRQHCAVHRVRNLLAKLPEPQRDRVRQAYWQALDDAINERDAKQRLQALVDELERAGYSSAARCLADDLDALVVHLRYPTRHRRRWRSTDESVKDRESSTEVVGAFSLRCGRGRPRSEAQDLGLGPAAQLMPRLRALRVAPQWRRPRPCSCSLGPWPASRRRSGR